MIKVTRVYWIRHCEAMGNVQRTLQGHVDTDISSLGAKQLSFLAKRFEDISVDAVYSSPLYRAVKTARAVADGKGIDVITHKGLIEMSFGILDGKPRDESFRKYPELLQAWNYRPYDFAPPEGEAMKDTYERVWNTLIEIVKESQDKTIAIATHGGVTRCICCRLLYNDVKRLAEVDWTENTGVACIEFDDSLTPTLKFYNDCSHLPKEYINPKSRFVKPEDQE